MKLTTINSANNPRYWHSSLYINIIILTVVEPDANDVLYWHTVPLPTAASSRTQYHRRGKGGAYLVRVPRIYFGVFIWVWGGRRHLISVSLAGCCHYWVFSVMVGGSRGVRHTHWLRGGRRYKVVNINMLENLLKVYYKKLAYFFHTH